MKITDHTKKSVDNLWSSLQAEEAEASAAYRKRVDRRAERGGGSLNRLASRSGPVKFSKSKKSKKKKMPKLRGFGVSVRKPKMPTGESTSSHTNAKKKSYDSVQPIPCTDVTNADLLLRSLQRSLNQAASDDRKTRKLALRRLCLTLFGSEFTSIDVALLDVIQLSEQMNDDDNDDDTNHTETGFQFSPNLAKGPVPASTLADLLPDFIKPLLKRMVDPVEQCREFALRMIIGFFQAATDLGPHLPYLFPVLNDRVPSHFEFDPETNTFVKDPEINAAYKRGKAVDRDANPWKIAVVEPSEELRLMQTKLVSLLQHRLCKLGSQAQLLPYFHDTQMFLHAALIDPFPEVKRVACDVILLLCETQPSVMKHYAVAFVRAVLPVLTHRHVRIRMAGLEALDALVTCKDEAKCRGAGTQAFEDLLGHRDANIIPVAVFYGKSDARKNVLAAMVQDKQPTVRARLMDALGGWLHDLPDRIDHGSRLLPYLLAGVSDESNEVQKCALHWLDRLGIQYAKEHPDEIRDRQQYGVEGSQTADYTASTLPPPFNVYGRPRIGTRIFVRNLCSRFLKPLLGELGNWISGTRLRSARMLQTMMIYMEEHITMESRQVIVALLRNISSDDVAVEQSVLTCAQLLGRYVHPEAYLPLLLPHCSAERSTNPNADANTCADALAILNKAIRGTTSKVLLAFIREILVGMEALDAASLSSLGRLRWQKLCVFQRIADVLQETGGRQALVDAALAMTGRMPDVDAIYRRTLALTVSSLRRYRMEIKKKEDDDSNGGDSLITAVAALGKLKEQNEYEKEHKESIELCWKIFESLAKASGVPDVDSFFTLRLPELLREALHPTPTDTSWSFECRQQTFLEFVCQITPPDALAKRLPSLFTFIGETLISPDLNLSAIEARIAFMRILRLLIHRIWSKKHDDSHANRYIIAMPIDSLLHPNGIDDKWDNSERLRLSWMNTLNVALQNSPNNVVQAKSNVIFEVLQRATVSEINNATSRMELRCQLQMAVTNVVKTVLETVDCIVDERAVKILNALFVMLDASAQTVRRSAAETIEMFSKKMFVKGEKIFVNNSLVKTVVTSSLDVLANLGEDLAAEEDEVEAMEEDEVDSEKSDASIVVSALVSSLENIEKIPKNIGAFTISQEAALRNLTSGEKDDDDENLDSALQRLRRLLRRVHDEQNCAIEMESIKTDHVDSLEEVNQIISSQIANAITIEKAQITLYEEGREKRKEEIEEAEANEAAMKVAKEKEKQKKYEERMEKQKRTDADVRRNQERLLGRFGIDPDKDESKLKWKK